MTTMEQEQNMDVSYNPLICHDETGAEKSVSVLDNDLKSTAPIVSDTNDVEIIKNIACTVNEVSCPAHDEVTVIQEKSKEIICIEEETDEVCCADTQTPLKDKDPAPEPARCEVQIFTTGRLVPYRDGDDGATSDSETKTDSDSESSSSETSKESSSSSDDDSDDLVVAQEKPGEKRKTVTAKQQPLKCTGIKTPGELDISDLPPIQDLHITLPKEELHPVGKVYNMVDQLLVIESILGQPILDLDSILFRNGGEPIGHVFDVFGPVSQPYYVIRFNKPEDIAEKKYEKGEPVYYAPLHADVTQYVFVSELKKIKGSDASWEHNNEPPPEHLDYSDDEQEREARRKRKTAQKEGGNVWRNTDDNTKNQSTGTPRKLGCKDTASRKHCSPNNTHVANRAPRPNLWNSGLPPRSNDSNGHQRPMTWQSAGNAQPYRPPPQIPPPRWMCQPPPLFGSPCRWPSSPALSGEQRMRQLWNSPPPPIGPPNTGYTGGLYSSPWNVGPPPPPPISQDPSGVGPPVWSQLYDPVPDLQRILMTPPPPLP